jgi:hypothetical protein
MSWTFEKLFKSSNTVAGTQAMAFDGKYVWVLSGTNAYVYSYWGEESNNEWLDQAYYFDRNTHSLSLVATINLGTSVYYITKWYNKMYISGGTSLFEVDILSRAVVTLPSPPSTINSICAANGKVFACSAFVNSVDQNVLYYFDIATQTWSSDIAIPGKKTTAARGMSDGLDGHLFITSQNDHSIQKFNTITGAFVASYRTNRGPYKLMTGEDKVVYVISDQVTNVQDGMITQFNQSTNVSTNFSGAGGYLYGIGQTDNHIWTIGGTAKLSRILKSDQDYRYYGGTAPGFTITFDDYTSVIPTTTSRGLVTPQLTYERWNGASFDTITVKPYLFFSTADAVYAARLNSMIRVNSMDVLGTAMIASGQQDYYGEN